MPDTWKNKEGPQTREPSKCLKGQSYGERLAKEVFQLPATRGSKNDSGRVITPAAEAVCVPAHFVPPGSLQVKQLHHLPAQLSLGQSCHRQKKSDIYVRRVALVVSNSLRPCRLWPARLLCQGRVFSRQECWNVLANAAAAKSLQSCLTLCNPMDSSPPGSSVHRIL